MKIQGLILRKYKHKLKKNLSGSIQRKRDEKIGKYKDKYMSKQKKETNKDKYDSTYFSIFLALIRLFIN